MKDDKWEGKPYDANGTVLTPEVIDEACKRAVEQTGYHPCQDGHLWGPKEFASKKGYCKVCCLWVDWT